MSADAPHPHRENRAAHIIAREAARFIREEAGSGSLITVTRAKSIAHGDRVTVFVSVFPTEKAPSALAFLERQRSAFSEHLKAHTHLRLPHIDFALENELPGGPSGN